MVSEIVAPIVAINRHRIGSDGIGVRTLIAFYGCPLHCRLCFNNECHNVPTNFMTPEDVLDAISIDDIYFRHSHGGITLGGGEPLLYPEFINSLRKICNPSWNFAVETSLNVSKESLKVFSESIDMFIVDLKLYDDSKYSLYTGASNHPVLENLKWLANSIDVNKIVVRIPEIPSITEESDIQAAIAFIKSLGIPSIDRFSYVLPNEIAKSRNAVLSQGKRICQYLKDIRHNVAVNNGLLYNIEECTFKGECRGTCPKCDADLFAITSYLEILENSNIKIKI